MKLSLRGIQSFAVMAAVFALCLVAVAACGGNDKTTSATRTPSTAASGTATPKSSGSATPAQSGSSTRSASPASSAGAGPEIKMIPTLKFDQSTLTIDAGKAVTLTVNNTDTGVRHSFVLYKTKADADANKPEVASTKVCSGPCKDTVELNLTAGEYFFHCSVHPAQMTGKLIAK